jgi:ATP-dependent RNA helicase DDX46/PRP5
MKKLITILVASFCLFIGTASAEKPGWSGKGNQAKDNKAMHKELRKQEHKDKYGRDDDNGQGVKNKDMHRDKDRDRDRDRDAHMRDGDDRGKHDEVRERLREKKTTSEQKEQEHLSDTAQEKRKKWWKFWE